MNKETMQRGKNEDFYYKLSCVNFILSHISTFI